MTSSVRKAPMAGLAVAAMFVFTSGCTGTGEAAEPASSTPGPIIAMPAPIVPSQSGGGQDSTSDKFTTTEWALITKLSPLPELPPDTTNAFADDRGAAALGQELFSDWNLSGPLVVTSELGPAGESGRVSCPTCHSSAATVDARAPGNVSLGADWGTRKALPITNSSFYKWSNWGGRFDSQWSLVLGAVENPKVMNGSRLRVVHLLYEKYRTEYEAIFGPLDPALNPNARDASRFPTSGKPKADPTFADGAWELMAAADQTAVNRAYASFGKAIGAYLRLRVNRQAPFDRFVAGDDSAISSSAKEGLRLFVGRARCVLCHSGPNFSDDRFHNEGLPDTGPHVGADGGRFNDLAALLASPWNSDGPFSDDRNTQKLVGLTVGQQDSGAFRTKSLRNLRGAGPYMHAGQLASLDLVLHFYSSGGAPSPIYGWGNSSTPATARDPLLQPLNLTADETTNLLAFLDALNADTL
jgi:cytochrome c peroxidase